MAEKADKSNLDKAKENMLRDLEDDLFEDKLESAEKKLWKLLIQNFMQQFEDNIK